jgi:hypothetical protein
LEVVVGEGGREICDAREKEERSEGEGMARVSIKYKEKPPCP